MKIFRFVLLYFLLFLIPAGLQAHQVASVQFDFHKRENTWELYGQMDIAYMLPESRGVLGGLPASREEVMKAPPAELERIRKETENTLRGMLKITFAGNEVAWKVEFPDFESQPFALPSNDADVALLTTRLVIQPRQGAGELSIHWTSAEQAELIMCLGGIETGDILSVQPGGSLVLLEQAADLAVQPTLRHPFWSWIQSGFYHVLPVGLDHMMFILGLFFMARQWRPLLAQSLLFTLSHSVTLALVVFGWLSPPMRMVEILIAFSIAFVGIENLFSDKAGKLRYTLVFSFGLIHGMGFASVLREKLVDMPKERLLPPLLGFNLGVELAQITVLTLAFLVFRPFIKWPRRVRILGSVVVAIFGLGWMVERLFA